MWSEFRGFGIASVNHFKISWIDVQNNIGQKIFLFQISKEN